jgi:molybdate transport system ATP-binding protein
VDAVDGKVVSATLAARIHKERRRPHSSSFVLDVSIEAPPGITILFGPSGAGKSTLLDCIVGLVRPDEGRIEIAETALFDSSNGIHLPPQHRRIAYVFQSLALFPHLTVEQNVEYGLHNMPRPERQGRVAAILETFRIEKLKNRKPDQISGGEKQRIALARSLVTDPRVLLLDEPLTGLDAALKASIVDDLRAWNAAKRIPILYVTHSREEVDALGERVIAIENGHIVGCGSPIEVLEAPRRKRLAQSAGFENLLAGTVLDLREPDGVMRVRLGESACELEVPLAHASAGDRVQIAIRAGDILLATERPYGLSARNILEGRIDSLQHRGAMLIARINCGVSFVAHVTPGAARSLNLSSGMQVWLVLKTHSCHFVE